MRDRNLGKEGFQAKLESFKNFFRYIKAHILHYRLNWKKGRV